MKQKTIYIDTSYDQSLSHILTTYAVGDVVILYGLKREGAPEKSEAFRVMKDNGVGVPGNVNPARYSYHGWRGTSDGVIKTAYGRRRIKAIEVLDKYSADDGFYQRVKIVVGADIAPDLD